jgi:hypothetical protein
MLKAEGHKLETAGANFANIGDSMAKVSADGLNIL